MVAKDAKIQQNLAPTHQLWFGLNVIGSTVIALFKLERQCSIESLHYCSCKACPTTFSISMSETCTMINNQPRNGTTRISWSTHKRIAPTKQKVKKASSNRKKQLQQKKLKSTHQCHKLSLFRFAQIAACQLFCQKLQNPVMDCFEIIVIRCLFFAYFIMYV